MDLFNKCPADVFERKVAITVYKPQKQAQYLGEACVREHANLIDDVGPVPWSSHFDQRIIQLLPHFLDPVCHA